MKAPLEAAETTPGRTVPSNTHETVLKVPALVGASLTAGAATGGQSLAPFEVATAKLNTSGPRTRFRPEPGRLNVTYTTLRIPCPGRLTCK